MVEIFQALKDKFVVFGGDEFDMAGSLADLVDLEQSLAKAGHAQERNPPIGNGAGVIDEPTQGPSPIRRSCFQEDLFAHLRVAEQ